MHPRIAELLAYLDRERVALRSAVEAVPRERHADCPGDGRWSVVQVIEHLALLERRLTGMFRLKIAEARAAGIGADPSVDAVIPTLDLPRVRDRTIRITAPQTVQPGAMTDLDDAWRELETARAGLRESILDGDGLALHEISHPHPVFGPLNLYRWIGFIAAHEARHADQIREIGASLAAAG